jgi:shikimate kinase
MPIAQIFGLHGEQKFRELERQVADNALAGPPAILAPGGGWAAQEGHIEKAKELNAFVVYLKVFPAVAANRASGDGTRPLLVGDDPLARMKKLLDEREPFYKKADADVPNDSPRTAEQATEEIVNLARAKAGWP